MHDVNLCTFSLCVREWSLHFILLKPDVNPNRMCKVAAFGRLGWAATLSRRAQPWLVQVPSARSPCALNHCWCPPPYDIHTGARVSKGQVTAPAVFTPVITRQISARKPQVSAVTELSGRHL